jgi:hypothetical protein
MKIEIERGVVTRRSTGEPVGFAESVTIEFQGQKFTAGGAYLTPTEAYGYPEFPRDKRGWPVEYVGQCGVINAADGSFMGHCWITGCWRTPRSFVSSHYHQIEALIQGVYYTGRSAGHGMLWHARRKARQRRAS